MQQNAGATLFTALHLVIGMMIILLCFFVVLYVVNAAQEVQFTRFDVAGNRSLTMKIHVDQITNVESTVRALCHTLYEGEGASALEIDRCILMAYPTVRDYKLQAFSEMLQTSLSKGVLDDATQMALQYAYEKRTYVKPVFRVCAIGLPTVDSVLSILYNSDAPEFWLFSKHKYRNSTTAYETFIQNIAKTTNKIVRFVYGDILTMLQKLQGHSRYRLCDVLHFEDSDIFGPALRQAPGATNTLSEFDMKQWIKKIGSVFVDSASDSGSEPVQVVWVRNLDLSVSSTDLPLVTLQNKSYVPHNFTAPLLSRSLRVLNGENGNVTGAVRWKVSSVWLNESRVTAIGNFDGFTGRSYYAPTACELHLREILLGEVIPAPDSSTKAAPKSAQHAEVLVSVDRAAPLTDISDPEEAIVVIAITFTIRVFAETAAGLRRALHSLGYAHVHIVPDMTLSAIDYLQAQLDSLAPTQRTGSRTAEKEQGRQTKPTRLLLQIALGPHDIAMLLPHYLVFQMEQTWSTVAFTGHYKTRYALVLSNALCVLAYSFVHAELLRALGYPCVHVIPLFSYTPEIETLQVDIVLQDGSEEKKFDFLFYGGCSERRRELLFKIRNLFPECSQESSISDVKSPCFNYSLHCVGWENGVFDAIRLTHVTQTRLLLNLHSDEDSVLEAHRLNYLLSLGKCVISERSGDAQLDARYASAVRFVNENDLTAVYSEVSGLLGNASALLECETRSRVLYAELSSDTHNLQLALSDAIQASQLSL